MFDVRRIAPAGRPNFRQRGYTSRWDAFAKQIKAERPLCARCQERGVTTAGYAVDHIRPVTGPDDPTFFDPAAVQVLCRACHSEKTAAEDGGFGNTKGKRKPAIGLDGYPIKGAGD